MSGEAADEFGRRARLVSERSAPWCSRYRGSIFAVRRSHMHGLLVMRSADLEPEYIQTLTRELSLTLNRETDVRAQPAGEPAATGTKGDPITVGSLALTFLTSGAAIA